MKDHLTPKEFAEAAGVSKQTIYRQLDGRLAPFVLTIKGQRMISADALSEFYEVEQADEAKVNRSQPQSTESKPDSTESKPKSTEESQPEVHESKLESTQNSQPESTEKQLEKRVEDLEKLIKEQVQAAKEEQAFLKDQIKIKDEQIKDLSKRLEAAHENLRVAQQLAAIDKQRLIALESTQNKQPDFVEQDAVVADPDTTDRKQEPGTQSATASKEPPTNFWGRLKWVFGFKN